MRRQLVIIGNAGAARECYWLVQDIMRAEPGLEFKGFLAFEGHEGDLKKLASYQLTSDDVYEPEPEDLFVLGLGLPELRLRAFHKWKAKGAEFKNLIYPGTNIQKHTLLGEANIITWGCAISCDVIIGDANFLNGSITFGHDVAIGDGNFFAPGCMALSGNVIGHGNLFGANSVLLPGARVGDNNTISAGAYVYKGCRNNCLMAGNPAYNLSRPA